MESDRWLDLAAHQPESQNQFIVLPPLITMILNGRPTREDALDTILARLVEEGLLPLPDVSLVRERLEAREKLGSTGIGQGVAFPHARHEGVDRPVMALALVRASVSDYETLDREPVDIVVLILGPSEPSLADRRFFEKLMSRFCRGLGDEIRRAGSPERLDAIVRSLDSGS